MTPSTTTVRAARLKLDSVETMLLSLGVLSLATLFSAAMALVAL